MFTTVFAQEGSGKARREEIARMLGGVEITAATEAHARQMLAHAQRG